MFEVLEDNEGERKVCASRALDAGTVLCRFAGKLIDYKKTTKLGNKESFAFQVEKDVYVFLDEPFRYFNHCCEPNCGVTPELDVVTLRHVDKNEELRYDYSTSMLEHHWKMVCTCKKESCRKLITDFDKLPKKVQQKYIDLNVVQDFILKQTRKSQI